MNDKAKCDQYKVMKKAKVPLVKLTNEIDEPTTT